MMNTIFAIVIVVLTVPVTALPLMAEEEEVSIRGIEEFLARQGTFCFPDALDGCLLFAPPLPNSLTFCQPDAERCGSVDYAGLAAAHAATKHVSFDTAVTGQVTERALADGTALVEVILRTENAFTWFVNGFDIGEDPLAFGHRIVDVLAGALPAFGHSLLRASFLNGHPGSPLPDLVELLFQPSARRKIVSLAFSAWAEGPLAADVGVPEGTPGLGQILLLRAARTPLGPDVPVDQIALDMWGKRGSVNRLVCCPGVGRTN